MTEVTRMRWLVFQYLCFCPRCSSQEKDPQPQLKMQPVSEQTISLLHFPPHSSQITKPASFTFYPLGAGFLCRRPQHHFPGALLSPLNRIPGFTDCYYTKKHNIQNEIPMPKRKIPISAWSRYKKQEHIKPAEKPVWYTPRKSEQYKTAKTASSKYRNNIRPTARQVIGAWEAYFLWSEYRKNSIQQIP